MGKRGSELRVRVPQVWKASADSLRVRAHTYVTGLLSLPLREKWPGKSSIHLHSSSRAL